LRLLPISSKCTRPTTVLLDDLVNLAHEADGFGKSYDDALVVSALERGFYRPESTIDCGVRVM
jgi:hypothetical protein